MTNINVKNVNRSGLGSIPIVHGNFIYCNDTKEVFYDNKDGVRGTISCVVCENESVRISIPINKRKYDTIYFVKLTSKLYVVSIDFHEFIEVKYTEEISYITGETVDLRPGFLKDEIKTYSPYSMASTILMDESMEMEDGPFSLQDYINDGRLSQNGFGTKTKIKLQDISITENNTASISIQYPIANYSANGFIFLLFRNGYLVHSSEYTVVEDVLTMIDDSDAFNNGEKLTIVFIYSVLENPANYPMEINGTNLLNHSVSLDKIIYQFLETTKEMVGEDEIYNVSDDSFEGFVEDQLYLFYISNKNTTTNTYIKVNENEPVMINSGRDDIPVGTLYGHITMVYNNNKLNIVSIGDATVYNLKKINSNKYILQKNGIDIGDPIDIPKMISSGDLKYCSENNDPLEGLSVGDPYIDLKIDDDNHIYIPANDLVDNLDINISDNSGNAITSITNEGNNITISKSITFAEKSYVDDNFVPNTRTIAGIPLDGDITLEELLTNLNSDIKPDWNNIENAPDFKTLTIGNKEYDTSEDVTITNSDVYDIAHSTVIKTDDVIAEIDPGSSGTFVVVDNVYSDTKGHATKLSYKRVKMPDIPTFDIVPPSSKDTDQKIYLIGATTQTEKPDATYSHDTVYVGSDGSLYSNGNKVLELNRTSNVAGTFYSGITSPTNNTRLNYSGYFYATRTFNAVYSDYAELFLKDDPEEVFNPGDVVVKVPGKKGYTKSYKTADSLVVGVVSSNYGHLLGGTGIPDVDEKNYIAIGLAGVIPVNYTGFIEEGDLLVSDKSGLASRAYPEDNNTGKIIGKVLEIIDNNKAKMLIMNA